MKSTITTHLICAPEIGDAYQVSALLVAPGKHVPTDTPLVLLHGPTGTVEVCAPEAGIVGDYMVAVNEQVAPSDILLSMEIEEKPFGFLPMVEEEPDFAPACQLAYPTERPARPVSGPLQIETHAASLAAQLGVDLSEVRPSPDGIIDEEAIHAHVRDILIRWRKLERLVKG